MEGGRTPPWRHTRLATCGMAILVLLLEVAAIAHPVLARQPARAAETIAETRLRADRSLRSDPLLRLPIGTTLTVLGKPEDGWYRARRGPLEGYVRSGDVATSPVPPADAQSGEAIDEPRSVAKAQRARGNDRQSKEERKQERKGQRKEDRKRNRDGDGGATQRDANDVITSTDLNLREIPAQDAPVREVIPRGEQVEPTGEHRDGWVELRWQGDTGWVLGRHLATPRPVVFKSDRDPTSWNRNELKAIIYDAADRYGQSRDDMLRVARCESNMIPSAINAHGGSYGLFQFKPGTWRSTPFADYDIFDPRPNANAAAWMWSEGRRREWVCQ